MQRRSLIALSACLAAGAGPTFAQSMPAAAKASQPWPQLKAAALKEGKVTLYTSLIPATSQRIKADFENANPGIVLEVVTLPGSQFIARVNAERSNNSDGADVVLNGELIWHQERAKEGSLLAPTGPNSKSFPPKYLLWGVVPILSIEPWVIAYNTNLVKPPITGYRDLLRPDLKGKIASVEIVNPSIVAWYSWVEKTNGADFLTKLGAQQPRLYTSGTTITQAIASGELLASAFATPSQVLSLIEQGAPVAMAIQKPSFGLRYGGAMLSWSKRPNASQVFIDYLMSPRGQTAFNSRTISSIASPLPGIPGTLQPTDVEGYDFTKYTPDVVKQFTDRMRKFSLSR